MSLIPNDEQTAYRQRRIVEAFQHAWKGYRTDAFGRDEYQPLTHSGHDWAPGGLGLMITDALDTMLLMNLTDEYNEAREWVATKLDFDKNQDVNLFETTIRVLGGLLSAYHLSGNDPVYLGKATDLGNRLLGAFHSESGIPYASVVLSTGLAYKPHVPSSTAEVTTIQLEFKYLSYLTGDDKYKGAVDKVMKRMEDLIEKGSTVDGLVPILIHPVSGEFTTSEIRLGSRGDSYYEYLLKQYLQTGKTEKKYRDMYDHAMRGVRTHLLGRSFPNNLLYIGELLDSDPTKLHSKMDHLVCFIGGSFALGATEGRTLADHPQMSQVDLEDLEVGKQITRTCYEMYNSTATGLASEIVYFNTEKDAAADAADIMIKPRDRHNILRPETLESIFLLWRLTGDEIYREWGWKIFEAFEQYTKLPGGGYAALKDVTQIPPVKDNRMDTFFLAETLKYLYLLFSPNDLLPLEHYVLNTEAHPLPVIHFK
ncbi:glycoside hydrolase [Radiomyces spectabilis]|uniref:glycoside hydrolase n=1 Tax=Radiomyces spectabilis TaxID=64574 RepID=UPI00221EEB52|nr:glycoside hydrolase [Radiomyces spectabilis]KAI8391840.1 glycoside hydrolase [Radiomyces spectabilis]